MTKMATFNLSFQNSCADCLASWYVASGNLLTIFAPFSALAPIRAPAHFYRGKNVISAPSVTKVAYEK